MKVNINPKIISQLLSQETEKAIIANSKFPEIGGWETRESKPTVTDLTKLASYFNIPFGYFFLEALPIVKYPIPHYRNGNQRSFVPSEDLLETINIIKARQNWARDLKKESQDTLPFSSSITINTNVKEAAKKIRGAIKLPVNWSKSDEIKTWPDAFRLLIRIVEKAGIFVVVNGVVNNSNKRKLKVDEFRGFVLHDDLAPFIFINNNDFITGKIFTIMHEIVHVFVGKSASFENKELLPANNEVEIFCNAVAAELLVPEDLLLDAIQIRGINFETLSREFRVSRIVIARRCYDFGKITKQELNAAYSSYSNLRSEKNDKKTDGGNFYHTAAYRIGKSFFNLIHTSVKQNKLMYRDAFRLTSLSPKSFDGYIKKVLK